MYEGNKSVDYFVCFILCAFGMLFSAIVYHLVGAITCMVGFVSFLILSVYEIERGLRNKPKHLVQMLHQVIREGEGVYRLPRYDYLFVKKVGFKKFMFKNYFYKNWEDIDTMSESDVEFFQKSLSYGTLVKVSQIEEMLLID